MNILLLSKIFLNMHFINRLLIIMFIISLSFCIYLYIKFIIYFFHKLTKSYHYNWIDWYKHYKQNIIQDANRTPNRHDINSLYLSDIENNIISLFKSQVLIFVCALSYILVLVTVWKYYIIWNNYSSKYIILNKTFLTNPIFSVLLITIISSLSAILLIYKSLKIAKSFYNLKINIPNIIESSLDILIPFYMAEISLLLSSANHSAYVCISLLIILSALLFTFIGIDAHIKNYISNLYYNDKANIRIKINEKNIYNHINNISQDLNLNITKIYAYQLYNMVKNTRKYAKHNSRLFPIVELPINNGKIVVQIPLKIFNLYRNLINK